MTLAVTVYDAPAQRLSTVQFGVDGESGERRGRAGEHFAEVSRRPRDFVAADTAGTGGAASVRLGQACEATVRAEYDFGPKAKNGRRNRSRCYGWEERRCDRVFAGYEYCQAMGRSRGS